LTGTSINNDMLYNLLSNAQITGFSATRVALGNLSGAVTIDYSAGHYYTVGTSAPITLAFTNFPAAGQLGVVAVQIIINAVGHTVTFPTAVSVNTTGIQGLDPITNIMSFAAVGVYTFTFSTSNNGSTVTVSQNNSLLTPLNASGETLTTSTASSQDPYADIKSFEDLGYGELFGPDLNTSVGQRRNKTEKR
jgi:hypothetical protein